MARHRIASIAAFVVASLAIQARSLVAQAALPQRFSIDASHSQIGFTVGFMGMSRVRGAFSGIDGTLMYAEGEPARSSVSVVIAANSINTNARQRDTHLKSPDFFDVEKYPYITFRSSRIAAAPRGFVARGTLTMHGVSKEVEIPFVQLNRPTPDAWGNSRQTFHGELAVSRKEYGIAGTAFWNSEFDPGRFAVGDQVEIDLLVSATIPNALKWGHPMGDSILTSIETDGITESTRRFKATYAGNPRVDSIPGFALIMVGQKLIQKGRLPDAIRFYETVLEVRPGSPAVRHLLGEAYVKSGQLPRARAEFEHALKDDPTSTMAAEWLRVLGGSG
jgi:polyisoprenoid-binding protein YceI